MRLVCQVRLTVSRRQTLVGVWLNKTIYVQLIGDLMIWILTVTQEGQEAPCIARVTIMISPTYYELIWYVPAPRCLNEAAALR